MLDNLIPISLFIMSLVVLFIGVLFIYEQYSSIVNQKKAQELECKFREQQIDNEVQVLNKLDKVEQQLKRVLTKLRIKE
jgi:hypothetical protein